MFLKTKILVAVALLLTATCGRAVETNVLVRDPSTVVKREGVYWVYGTGPGCRQFSSTDRINWTPRGPVFLSAPAWVAGAVPQNKNNLIWAPDVHEINGKYFLYYSYSSMGSKVSGIGVATSANLDPQSWADQGPVVTSGAPTDFNTIDPCIFQDAEGKPWLSFGSYFSGIKLVALDPQTGKRSDDKIYALANRPNVPGNAIEASAVYFHDGYYYLFVNWDGCCAGAKSTYNIRMGRSRSVTGPYLDALGQDMNQGGGTLFLNAIFDNGSGRPIDDEIGPGHVGILRDTDGFWLTTHYEWALDKRGATTMNLHELVWDSDGWPRAILDAGPYKIVSALATHGVLEAAGDGHSAGSPLQTKVLTGSGQQWTLQYQADGFYNVILAGSPMALSVAGCAATAGAPVELAPLQNLDCQQWHLQRNEDGTFTLLSKSSKRRQALDVSRCALTDAAPVAQNDANNSPCQKWTFRSR